MKDKILGFLNILLMLGAFMYIGARSANVSLGWTDSFFGLFVPLLSALVVYVIHLVLHEAGHLAAGLITGYKFVSFRIGSIILIKNKSGKCEFRRMTVLGTGGQCLMCPPDVPTEECPYKLYHLMGGLTNIIVGLIGLILCIVLPKGLLNFCFFETSAVLGFMLGITNLIPTKINGTQNDGYNLVDLGRNKFAKKSLNLVLSLNALLTVADSYDDLPKELVDELMAIDFTKEDLTNASIANAFNYQAALLFAKGDYEKAYETQKYIADNNDILGIFRNEAECECLFFEIINDMGSEVIDARYDKTLEKYIKATSIYPARQRLMYAYYKLYKKDELKASECMKKLEKMIDTYSVKADAILELETARKIVEKADSGDCEDHSMNISDIFSWLSKEEMTLEEIESIVVELYRTNGEKDGFSLEMQLPADVDENIIGVNEELINEGKKVCFLMRNGRVIAAAGYRL